MWKAQGHWPRKQRFLGHPSHSSLPLTAIRLPWDPGKSHCHGFQSVVKWDHWMTLGLQIFQHHELLCCFSLWGLPPFGRFGVVHVPEVCSLVSYVSLLSSPFVFGWWWWLFALYNSDWARTHDPTSPSWVLGLRAYTTIPGFSNYFFKWNKTKPHASYSTATLSLLVCNKSTQQPKTVIPAVLEDQVQGQPEQLRETLSQTTRV